MKRLAAFFWLLGCGAAFAQSNPNWGAGKIPTAGEWNALWASKTDVASGTLNTPTINAPTIQGQIGGTYTLTGAVTLSSNALSVGGLSTTSALTTNTTTLLENHSWTYSGAASPGWSNFNLAATSSVSGTSANTSQYPINEIVINPSLKTAQDMMGLYVWNQQQAGFWGVSTALFAAANQAGTPTPPATWAGTTAYSPAGLPIYNGTNEYQLVSASCTSGNSGGPTGTGSEISDGTCSWNYVTPIAQSYYNVTFAAQANMTQNVGGSATGYVGFNFGGNAVAKVSSSATYYSESIGFEADSFNTLVSHSPARQAIMQLVKSGNGAQQDWGMSVQGASYNAALFSSAVMANGVGISFSDQNTGGLQTMAGAFDCLMCSATGTDTTSGYFVTGGGGYILRGPNAQLLGTGDLQIGSAGFHISATTLTLDTTYELLSAVGGTSGGTNWVDQSYAVDDYGNVGVVSSTSGIPSSVSLTCGANPCPKTYVAAASLPGGAVTWHAMYASNYSLDSAGGDVVPTNFTTASETYTAGTTLNFGTGTATTINIGNSGSTTTINGGIKAGSSTGQSQTCTVNTASPLTLIFTHGILTGGTCNS